MGKEPLELEIVGIEPNAGPTYGETRVLVRLKSFDRDLIDEFDKPKCRFGSNLRVVEATYVLCTPLPRLVGQSEPKKEDKTDTCIQCEISPAHNPDIVPLTVTLLGDFSDIKNSIPYRYYEEPQIHKVFPQFGRKNGGTYVEVFGKNFLNFDQNLRCAFGSVEVKAYYISNEYIVCYSPKSDVVQKELPFSISLNNQQNSRQNIDWVYYDDPQVSRLEPNKGPDTGGTKVIIKGQYFNPSNGLSLHNYDITLCRFGNLTVTQAEVLSSTEMRCVSPPSFVDREVPVEISLNTREWTDDGILFYYYHPPFIYGIEPRIGDISGGTTVKITGSNFQDTGKVYCRFGSIQVKGKFINENELQCVSPAVEKPGIVNIYVAIRDDEFSSGSNTKYLYYDTPIIERLIPECGPESGFTQISVMGKNFANTGSDYVKCVFNKEIFTNATVISDKEIKCDSPSVLNFEGVNVYNITEYNVEITLNGKDFSGPAKRFGYYKETYISSIEPKVGPKEGKTSVEVIGADFNQKNACNITIRISTYHVKPSSVQSELIAFDTPQVNFTGSTVVQVALNGQQFDKDINVNKRDIENTYYYYKKPLVRTLSPKKGPTVGGSILTILGVGLDEIFFNIKSDQDKIMYYRFIDADDKITQYGETQKTIIDYSHFTNVVAPIVAKNNTRAKIELSYNNENFDITSDDLIYTYYTLPNITSINPIYGPLKVKTDEERKIMISLDNYICTDACENIICRFKSRSNTYYQKATYELPNKVSCLAPEVSMPETFIVETSFNDDDYTNNGKTYTFFDPYVTRVEPIMISSRGGTKINIYGFGFANSAENLKVQYGSEQVRLRCNFKSCIFPATFLSEEKIQAETPALKDVTEATSGESIGFQKFAVEVSVYNNVYTDNMITIFYFDEPEIIEDIYSSDSPIPSELKEIIGNALVHVLPANLDSSIIIPIDSRRINKYFSQFNELAKYTCQFTMEGDSTKSIITPGIITSFPLKSDLNNIFLCQTPKWENVGKAVVRISLNGVDFSETSFALTFTDPVKIFSIEPPCGPRSGGTKVKFIGSGFINSEEYHLKWGVQNLVSMATAKFNKKYKKDELSPKIISNFELDEIEVLSPQAPEKELTTGGPDYIAYSKNNYFPLDDLKTQFHSSEYFHTNFEFYYYKQPYVQSFSPHGSIVTGGTTILVVGAWFDYKPEYEVRPYCRFGDKIVEGTYLSTVRITCVAPEYHTANVRVPLEVSLNKVDFTNSGLTFTYYNDYTKAKFNYIEPSSGPETGGTNIKVYGESFTSLLNEEEFLCLFNPKDSRLEPKKVPAGFQDFGNNKTAIICNTPGGWSSGTVADIQITFDGQNFFDTGFDFYFYKITHLNPSAGPSVGGDPIQVIGSGFQNSTKVKCSLNKVEMKPIDVFPDKILCPMPQSTYGKNFTGSVDFGVTLNGIDWKIFSNGFYYYYQPEVTGLFPLSGPSKGNPVIKVYGDDFRNNFPGSNTACKLGKYVGQGVVVSNNEINCEFKTLPLVHKDKPLNISIALNSYSFTEEQKHLNFTPYGVSVIKPSSGVKEGGTRIEIHGSGFFDSKTIRCRFGVPGWYGYTEGQFIDYNRVICSSPIDFNLPQDLSRYPFSVPFSISFNEDQFNPWTETPHYFTIFEQPIIESLTPQEGKTSMTTEVKILSNIEHPFSIPSATIQEIEYVDYSKVAEGEIIEKKAIKYQSVSCRFGRFGTTRGKYYNRTMVTCLTPTIQDDSDIGYEEVQVEIALNEVDYITNDNLVFTFIGPNAGRMVWVYILIVLFMLLLIILLIALVSTYWRAAVTSFDKDVRSSAEPHIINKKPKYFKDSLDKDNS